MFSSYYYGILRDTPEQVVTNRKFNIALRKSDLEYTKKVLDAGPILLGKEINLRLLLKNNTKSEILGASTSCTLIPTILKKLMNPGFSAVSGKKKEEDLTVRIMSLCRSNLDIQNLYNSQCDHTLNRTARAEKFQAWLDKNCANTSILTNLIMLEKELSPLVEKVGSLTHLMKSKAKRNDLDLLSQKCRSYLKSIGMKLSWNRNVAMMHMDGTSWLLPVPYILQIHNKICDFISCLVLIRGCADVCFEKDAEEKLLGFISELCSACLSHEDNYFAVGKTLEGVITGEIVKREEAYENSSLLRNIAKDLYEEGYDYLTSDLRDLLNSCSTPLLHELGGVTKIVGHPLISMDKTVTKFLEKVQAKSQTTGIALQKAANCAKEAFIRNYILKHHKWPDVNIDELAPRPLAEAYHRGVDPKSKNISSNFGEVVVDDYVYIDLKPILKFDRVHHYAQHLKDKTIALVRNKIVQKYVQGLDVETDWKETRLLLYFLCQEDDHDNLQSYLSSYMASPEDMEEVLNYLCIKLVPKEKELKEAARLFGCKTYEDRFRSKVQEENACHFMDQYMFDQSMTLSNLGLVKRLYAFRMQNQAYKGWRALWVNFDVSSWAEGWRKDNTAPILKQTLDKLYDTDIFSKTHDAYEKGMYYIPNADGSAYHWEGQLGGVQGLNQYTWMNCYVPLMRSLLSQFGMHFYVMAYGDDYKACFLIPPDQAEMDMQLFKDQITRIVADSAIVGFGHKMKPYDSYGSECYVSFCKKASVKGIELPQGLRKIQKCHGSTNAFLPTIDDYVSGAYSNAHGACKESTVTFAPYMVAIFWTFYHLITHVDYTVCTDDELVALTLTPSLVGGLPIIYLHNFHTRSESDYLAPFLDLIKFLEVYSPTIADIMKHFLDYDPIPVGEGIETLLRDPYALPISKPPQPEAVLRKMFAKTLIPMIRNEDVLELVEAAEDDSWHKRFVKCLTSSKVLQARLLSAIYASCPRALLEEFLRRFENSASIKEVLIIRTGVGNTRRCLRNTIKSDRDLQKWRSKILTSRTAEGRLPLRDEQWCPSKAADILRSRWGKPVTGVSMAPSQHMVSLIEEERGSVSDHAIDNHFRFVRTASVITLKDGNMSHWSLGKNEPFHGHKTRLNMEMPTIRITEHNPQLLKLQNLLDMISWTNKRDVLPDGTVIESNLSLLLFSLIKQYYKGDVDDLAPFSGKTKGGTIPHHLRSPHYKEFIMPNTLYNLLTNWRSETNSHLFFSLHPGYHFSINFLLLRCFCVHELDRDSEFSSDIVQQGKYWGVTNNCNHCRQATKDAPIVIDETLLPPDLRILNFTRLDQQSKLVIKEALAEFQESEVLKLDRVGGPIPVEHAALTVMAYVVNRDFTAHRGVRDRFCSGMPMTEAAKRLMDHFVANSSMALVRLTEIKKLPVQFLVEGLCNIVYDYISSNYASVSRPGILAEIKTRPAPEFPWLSIIRHIAQAGRLGGMLNQFKSLTGLYPPAGFSNYGAVAKYVALCSLEIMDSGGLKRRASIATYFDDETVARRLRNSDYGLRARYIATEIIPDINNARTGYGPQDFCPYTAGIMYICMIPADDYKSSATKIVDAAKTGEGMANYSPIMYEHDELNDDGEYMPEEDEYVHMMSTLHGADRPFMRIVEYYKHKYPDLGWEMSYNDFCKHVNNYWLSHFFPENIPDNLTVSICVTNIAESILIVRGLDTVNDNIENDNSHADRLIPEKCSLRNIDVSASFVNVPIGGGVDTVINEDLIVDNTKLLLPVHQIFRPYGTGTSSLNKVAYILSKVGLLSEDSKWKNLSIACLAEGNGGILDLLAKLTTESKFLFNTIPDNEQINPFPEQARDSLREGHHHLSTRLVSTNVCDLRCINVVEAIGKEFTMIDILTCDAECDWSQELSLYASLITNVSTLFLRTRMDHSILILKIFGDAGAILYHATSLLARYCTHVSVIRCPGSPPGSELYIFAQGVRSPFTGEFTDKPERIIPTVVRRLNALKTKLTRELSSLYDNYQQIIPLGELEISLCGFMADIHHLYPPIILQRISAKLGVPIFMFRYTEDIDELVEELVLTLRPVAMAIRGDLEAGCFCGKRTWNSDTHTAQVLTALNLVSIESLIKFAPIVLNYGTKDLRTRSVQDMFVQTMDSLPERVFGPEQRSYNTYNSEIYHKGYKFHSIPFNFYERWLESLGWALGLRSWFLTQIAQL